MNANSWLPQQMFPLVFSRRFEIKRRAGSATLYPNPCDAAPAYVEQRRTMPPPAARQRQDWGLGYLLAGIALTNVNIRYSLSLFSMILTLSLRKEGLCKVGLDGFELRHSLPSTGRILLPLCGPFPYLTPPPSSGPFHHAPEDGGTGPRAPCPAVGPVLNRMERSGQLSRAAAGIRHRARGRPRGVRRGAAARAGRACSRGTSGADPRRRGRRRK